MRVTGGWPFPVPGPHRGVGRSWTIGTPIVLVTSFVVATLLEGFNCPIGIVGGVFLRLQKDILYFRSVRATHAQRTRNAVTI